MLYFYYLVFPFIFLAVSATLTDWEYKASDVFTYDEFWNCSNNSLKEIICKGPGKGERLVNYLLFFVPLENT
jgi:hypothetical protein